MERKIIKMSAPRCIKHSALSVTTQPAENIDLPRFKLRYSYQLHWTSRCYSVLNIWLCCQNPVSDVKRENTPNRSPRAPSSPLRTFRDRDALGAAPRLRRPSAHSPAGGWTGNAAATTGRRAARSGRDWCLGRFPQQTATQQKCYISRFNRDGGNVFILKTKPYRL